MNFCFTKHKRIVLKNCFLEHFLGLDICPQTLKGLKPHQLPVRNKEKVEEKRRNSNKLKKLLKVNICCQEIILQ
ncbi:unnamed protein product, partial [Vitis vinifera]